MTPIMNENKHFNADMRDENARELDSDENIHRNTQ